MGILLGGKDIKSILVGEVPATKVMLDNQLIWSAGAEKKLTHVGRFSSPTDYDQSFIELMESLGYTSEFIKESEIAAHDFSQTTFLSVGAPSDSYDTVQDSAVLHSLNVDTVIMCRSTARNAFGMSSSSTSTNVDEVLDIATDTSVLLGPNYDAHSISSLSSGVTELCSHGGYSIGARIDDVSNGRKVFWGYHRFEGMTQAGKDYFIESILSLSVAHPMDNLMATAELEYQLPRYVSNLSAHAV